MFIIRLSGLSMTSAEDLLVRIWCALEEHDIARPSLSVQPGADGGLNVAFTFRTRQEAERITSAVPMLAPTVGSKTAPLLVGAGWAH
jgi:hypothetical protein